MNLVRKNASSLKVKFVAGFVLFALVVSFAPAAIRKMQITPAKIVAIPPSAMLASSGVGERQETGNFKSISHPFPPPPVYDITGMLHNGSSAMPVASSDNGVWYSSGVNAINHALLQPDATWLGTECGVKRLDKRTNTVQHFTTLEGLPFNRVSFLAAHGNDLFCCSNLLSAIGVPYANYGNVPRRSEAALCRFDATSGKWVTVVKESRDYPADQFNNIDYESRWTSQVIPFQYKGSDRQCVTVSDQNACLVMGPGMPGKSLALISPLQGGSAYKVLTPDFAKKPFRIYFAHADSANLWIGSDIGLLRYDFKTKEWESFLPNIAVTGGCPDENGGLWLLTSHFDPVQKDQDGYKIRNRQWEFTHFVLGSSPKSSHLYTQQATSKGFGGERSFYNIAVAGGKVWTTADMSLSGGGHGQMAYFPDIYMLDIQAGIVGPGTPSAYASERGYANIPDIVLINALTYWRIPMPLNMQKRFRGWICPEDVGNSVMLSATDEHLLPHSHWSAQSESGNISEGFFHRKVLKFIGSKGELKEIYTFPPTGVAYSQPSPVVREGDILHVPSIMGLRENDLRPKRNKRIPATKETGDADYYKIEAADSAAVWILGSRQSERFLLRFDLKAHTWRTLTPQPNLVIPQYNERFIADGETCWMLAEQKVYRLNLNTKLWARVSSQIEQGSAGFGIQQIEFDGNSVWLVSATTDAKMSVLPQSPIVPLFRYSLKTHTFSPIQPSVGKRILPRKLSLSKSSILLTSSEGVFRFDRATETWKLINPSGLLAGIPEIDAVAAREDDDFFWFIGRNDALKWRKQ